jgi:L-asparaginase/Glu-tRNA(Gln) amidotransferase subunit D
VEGHVRIPVGIRYRSPVLRPDPAKEVRVGVATIVLGDDGRLAETIGAQVDGLVVAAFGVARILLHLLVASGADPARIRDTFASAGGLS